MFGDKQIDGDVKRDVSNPDGHTCDRCSGHGYSERVMLFGIRQRACRNCFIEGKATEMHVDKECIAEFVQKYPCYDCRSLWCWLQAWSASALHTARQYDATMAEAKKSMDTVVTVMRTDSGGGQ